MRYLVAPDKFKGTLTAVDAAHAIARGIRRADPDAAVAEFPFADGGEGTVQAVVSAGAAEYTDVVTGPLGDPVSATWAIYQGVAFIEMAEASGLRHVSPSPASAWHSDTAGVGDLIARALDKEVRSIVIGVGGSATTDGGFGALRSLGCVFLDSEGGEIHSMDELHRVASLDVSGIDKRLESTPITICADVLAPLGGVDGAAQVFGPQKGADDATIARLERRLEALSRAYRDVGDVEAITIGGAAGGLAAGLAASVGARVASGVDVLAELLGLDEKLRASDVVIVGEGSLDEQSRFGKTPVGIARRARALGVPAIAIAGASPLASDALRQDGIVRIATATEAAGGSGRALARPAYYVEVAAEQAVIEHRGVHAAWSG